ncbi:MAG: trypsin-like peptidase domain-containing protein [Burkholderiales bacterium]
MKHLLTLMLLMAQAGPALAALDPAALIKLSSSVLKVEVIRTQGGFSLGSGVVVGSERVVTNCHVTRDARQIAVLQGGLRLPAQSQQVDAYHDLCLLHVRGVDSDRAVTLGQAGQLTIGQPVTAIGHTAGAMQRSAGGVLALHRMDGARVIQSSNAFSSGASGGGLFDAEARLVGILSFRLRGGTAHYFSVPAEWLARDLDDVDRGQPVGPIAPRELAFWEQPSQEQPLFLRAAVLERDGDWRTLQPLAADWARRDAGNPEPWYLLGLALDMLDEPGQALHALECSLAIDPDFESARAEIERVHLRHAPSSDTAATTSPCRL